MFHAQQMVDLARSPEEIKEDMPQTAPSIAKAPLYPYGCSISLGNEELEKCGLTGDLPAVGMTIHFCCEAKVTCSSQTEREGEEPCRRVELQICRLGIPGADAAQQSIERSAIRQKSWYGGGEPDGDDD